MKVTYLFFFILFSQTAFSSATAFKLSSEIYENSNIDFIAHHGEGRFGSYLTMEVKFEPIAELFKQLLINKKKQLANRGEAHITVITPLEFFDTLKEKKITMSEIDAIAKKYKLQSARFKVLCLGKGTATIDNKDEETYYVVVASDDLLEIRREIYQLFANRNGDPNAFNPEDYFPHITLGFTKRDLHESDGVIKNVKSCVETITVN